MSLDNGRGLDRYSLTKLSVRTPSQGFIGRTSSLSEHMLPNVTFVDFQIYLKTSSALACFGKAAAPSLIGDTNIRYPYMPEFQRL